MASNWTTVAFGEIARLEQGLCFNKKTNHLMAETGIPLLRIADLINNTQTKFVDEERVPRKFIAKPQDIIYSRTGQVGLVFKGKVGVVHNNCFRVIPQDGIERDYVYWYLKQPSLIQQARSLASGAAQPDLGHDAFKSILFSYPEQETQRKIAAILTAYDDLIENNLRRIKILERLAQSIYCEWFIHFRFPEHKAVETINDPEFGLIPSDWRVSSLNRIFPEEPDVVVTGPFGSKLHASDYRSDGVPLILVKHVKDGRIYLQDMPLVGEHKLRELDRYRLQIGDIVVTRVAVVGETAYIYPPFENWLFSGQMLRVRIPATGIINSRYLAQYYLSPEFKNKIQNFAVGATRLSLNTTILASIPIIVPPFKLQSEFANKVDKIDILRLNLIQKNANLARTRDLLLPKLVSGELDVSELDIPVPEKADYECY